MVSSEETLSFAQKSKATHMQTSAKYGTGIDELFKIMAEKLWAQQAKEN